MDEEDELPLLDIGLEQFATEKTSFDGCALAVGCTIDIDRIVDIEMQYDTILFQCQ